MLQFSIGFFICNLYITLIILCLLIARRIFGRLLSCRMKYNLWLVLFALMAVPFLPIRVRIFPENFSIFSRPNVSALSDATLPSGSELPLTYGNTADWMNDLTVSISQRTPSIIEIALTTIWLIGMLVMAILFIRSGLRLKQLMDSSLPLQDDRVQALYQKCRAEMHVTRNIPVYSTAYLTSPAITGYLFPRIYLPIHLISDYNAREMRYMLLHEFSHYRHKDALANHLMNTANILYWFNPFVWYALKEMRNDREEACDISVLQMLENTDYESYGHTLINLAQKISHTPFSFTAGMSGTMSQIKQRILNIACYRTPTRRKRLGGIIVSILISLSLLFVSPALSIRAAGDTSEQGRKPDNKVTSIDYSKYFDAYEGSFVLYDPQEDSWSIYNEDDANTRTAPASTYKIYNALFGLEAGVITPEDSGMSWNHTSYPLEMWNSDQDLISAMQNSVNWYFQNIDTKLGIATVRDDIRAIGYGNQKVSGDLSSYWMTENGGLKISPVEQVELLKRFYNNELGFDDENIQAVKDAILLSSTSYGSLSGKTGTMQVDGRSTSGWFIGYLESEGHTYFFATHIQADQDASGAAATEITLSILSELYPELSYLF